MLSISLLALALPAAAPAAVQSSDITFDPALQTLLSTSSAGDPNSPLTQGNALDLTITGDFNGDATPDIAFLDNGELRFSTAPGLFNAASFAWSSGSPIGTITQLATLPRLDSEPADQILALTDSGLYRLRHQPGGAGWAQDQIAGQPWAGAFDLRARFDPRRGTKLVSAVLALGDSVGVLEIGPESIASHQVPVGSVVHEALVLDRFADGSLDVVVGSTTSFAVLDLSGALVYGFPLQFETMEHFLRADDLDAVVWVAKGPDGSGGTFDFLIVDPLGQSVDALGLPLTNQFLGAMGVFDLVAEDMDDDGDDDLLLVSASSPSLHAIENDGGAGILNGAGNAWDEAPYFHGPGTPYESTDHDYELLPTVADFDMDGTGDLLLSDETTGAYHLAAGTTGSTPVFFGSPPLDNDIGWMDLGDARFGCDTSGATNPPTCYLFLPMTAPTLPTPPAASALYVEVVGWRQLTIGPTLNPQAEYRQAFPIATGTQIPALFSWELGTSSTYFMVRAFAAETATGRITRVYEPEFFGMSVTAPQQTELDGLEGADTSILVPNLLASDNWTLNGVDFGFYGLDPSVQNVSAITVTDPIVKKVRRLPDPIPVSEPTTTP